MIEITDLGDMRSWSRDARSGGDRVGLVATMGFLHEGHLRLIDRSLAEADRTVLSIFVNRLQFGPGEDLESYPRDIAHDRAAAERRGVESLFVPDAAAMYPTDPEVRLIAGSLSKHLCGPSRPGHFDGVLTVVAKLFNIVEPDVALFGRKDFQQAQIVKRMAADLNFPTEVVIVPTVRDVDSVALSSRNAYLSEADREVARRIPLALDAAHRSFLAGKTCVDDLVAEVHNTFGEHEGAALDYVEIVDPSTLAPISMASSNSIVGLAARIGGTRLIDNIVVGDGVGGDDFVHG